MPKSLNLSQYVRTCEPEPEVDNRVFIAPYNSALKWHSTELTDVYAGINNGSLLWEEISQYGSVSIAPSAIHINLGNDQNSINLGNKLSRGKYYVLLTIDGKRRIFGRDRGVEASFGRIGLKESPHEKQFQYITEELYAEFLQSAKASNT